MNKSDKIINQMKTDGVFIKDFVSSSSFSAKKYSTIVEHPGFLLVDFADCNDKSAEVFIVDNINKDVTELQKFAQIGKFLKENVGILTPELQVLDSTRVLVEHLGSKTGYELSNNSSNYGVFRQVLEDGVEMIVKMIKYVSDDGFKHLIYQRQYDEKAMLSEMGIFMDQWFKRGDSGNITDKEANQAQWEFELVVKRIFETGTSLIHRDFQSANLIYYKSVTYTIDFQDACLGPRFYDIASMLYDLKISLSNTERKRLIKQFLIKCPTYIKKNINDNTGNTNQISEKDLVGEIGLNGLIRLCKSLALRLKCYRDPNNRNNKELRKNLFREIKRGIDIFYCLQEDLNKWGYDGQLLQILDKIFSQFNQENWSGIITIILGAGQGKRMGGTGPKVLEKCLELPMLEYPLRISKMLGSDGTYVVVGYKKEMVMDHVHQNLGQKACTFVVQEQLMGTGHAVMQVMPLLLGEQEINIHPGKKDEIIVIMAGDVPVLDYQMMHEFIQDFQSGDYLAGILTTNTPHPDGCGRIIRDEDGKFIGTIEEKDIGEDQEELRNICEISTGTMVFRASTLFEYIMLIDCNNAQGEFYLPDVVNILLKKEEPVLAHNCARVPAIHGANTREQLELLEKWMKYHILSLEDLEIKK